MGQIRVFREEDIPAVARLRPHAFASTERASTGDLESYFHRIFFANPWRDIDLPSHVYEERGRLIGFLGVVPRTMRFRGESIRVAVGTQFMVDPASRGLPGVVLMKHFLAGPQDLTLADSATDPVRRTWEHLGGRTSPLLSFTWTKPFQTATLAQMLAPTLPRALRLGMRPVWRCLDWFAARSGRTEEIILSGVVEPLTPAQIIGHVQTIAGRAALSPAYDVDSLSWLLRELAEKQGGRDTHALLVRDDAGNVTGWFVYFVAPNGVAQVVQVAAQEKHAMPVLRHLFRHAGERGAVAASGRVASELVASLGESRCLLACSGPWFLFHSRREEIAAAIDRGDAFLSRLDGEWWMSF